MKLTVPHWIFRAVAFTAFGSRWLTVELYRSDETRRGVTFGLN